MLHLLQPKKNLLLLPALLFMLLVPVIGGEVPVDTEYNDGPYIFYQGDSLEARWVCNGNAIITRHSSDDSIFPNTKCGKISTVPKIRHFGDEAEPAEFTDVPKIAALSDIHGQHEIFIRLLTAHGIIDQHGHWSWGNGHLVIVGDILDRGPRVMETLWFLYSLEAQANAAGGRVHVLLGNHEVMVLQGDLRYLHPKYEFVAKTLNTDYDELFSKKSVLGRWLRTKPVALKINDFLFVHGGIHPQMLELGLSFTDLNTTFQSGLDYSREAIDQDEGLDFLYGGRGPIWYRGYFPGEKNELNDLKPILAAFGVQRIVVGHTSMEVVSAFHGGRVLAVDSSIKRGETGEILIWEGGEFFRGTLTGERMLLGQ